MRIITISLILLLTGSGGLYAQKPPFNGMTQNIGYDKMIPPLGIEVTYNKTVHILFLPGLSMLIWEVLTL